MSNTSLETNESPPLSYVVYVCRFHTTRRTYYARISFAGTASAVGFPFFLNTARFENCGMYALRVSRDALGPEQCMTRSDMHSTVPARTAHTRTARNASAAFWRSVAVRFSLQRVSDKTLRVFAS